MVWIPDAIVTSYFTRDSAPDASNRARHHCNACQLVFPVGNNTTMRTHLLACPSLPAATITSIASRIASELASPKRITRDPRWTKAEEQALLELDANVPSGKKDGKYQKMAISIGRSAQACRQKLIHLKETQAVKNGEQETTKRVLWNRKTKSSKSKTEEEGEEDEDGEDLTDIAFEDVPQPAKTTRRVTRNLALRLKVKPDDDDDDDDDEMSPKAKPARGSSGSDATISHRSTSTTTRGPETPVSPATDEFLRLLRWHIHSALTNFHVMRGFYSSDLSIESGWGAFVASNIPHAQKDAIVARLIGLWLDGLDTEGFEREVDAKIESVVLEMSEWAFEAGNPMMKAIEEHSTEEEDSGYEADGGYADGGAEATEL